MLESERLMFILESLTEHPAVKIREISVELNVSEATVRRDLDELQRQGKLKRQHGGAVLNSVFHTLSDSTDWTINEKTMMNTGEKRKACELASDLINDGDCIYIDGGSTMSFLIPFIKGKRIHIVTPSILFIRNLGNSQCSVEVIGGTYEPFFDMNLGSRATETTGDFRYDKAFFGVAGIDALTKECYSATVETVSNKQTAMKHSLRNFLIIDSSKFDRRGFCYCCSADEFEKIFTDQMPSFEHNLENLHPWKEKHNEKK